MILPKKISKYYKSIKFFTIVLFAVLLLLASVQTSVHLKKERISKDYQTLSSFNPEDIIYYQKISPHSWKESIAIISAIKHYSEVEIINPEEIYNKLTMELTDNNKLAQLNWTSIDKNIKKLTFYYYKILNKYPIYSPNEFFFPVERPSYYTDTYGAAREGGKRLHEGVDLFDKKGTKIISVCSGKVEKIGWNRLGGERVGVRGNDGCYYYYAHLDMINEQLYVGKKIRKGELIGTMGNTGDAITTPDHLHFGIELPNGDWVNPYPFLKVWEFNQFQK
ncbi:MAG: M23 family metallopeptidase [Peptococcaceae bacterium]|nr:M23 family metallopeptidase [Peptococcaceae bacterium]